MKLHKELMMVGILYGLIEWLFLGLACLGSTASMPHLDGVAVFMYIGIAGGVVSAMAALNAFRKAGVVVSSNEHDDFGYSVATWGQPQA